MFIRKNKNIRRAGFKGLMICIFFVTLWERNEPLWFNKGEPDQEGHYEFHMGTQRFNNQPNNG